MIKLVVADFDGTLLPYGMTSVSSKVIGYIKSLVLSGVKFAVASGRTYSELSVLLADVKDDIYFICDDGAVALRNDKVIFRKPFTSASLRYFFDTDLFRNVTLYALDKAYLIGDVTRPILYGKTPCRIQRHIEIKDEIFKVCANVKCFDLVDTSQHRIHYSDKDFAEFVSFYANKGVAIGDLQLKLGVSKFETVVIGDADNDIPMTSHAQRSWAIGDRSEKLKSKSTDFTDSIEFALEAITNNIH